MIGQGYSLQARMGGRWYHVIGWVASPRSNASATRATPVGVPADHRDADPGAFELLGAVTQWCTPEPARELAAQIGAVLDEFEGEAKYGGSAPDLVRTLRALLASWST